MKDCKLVKEMKKRIKFDEEGEFVNNTDIIYNDFLESIINDFKETIEIMGVADNYEIINILVNNKIISENINDYPKLKKYINERKK